MNDLVVILILVALGAVALFSCICRKNRGCGGSCGGCNGCSGCGSDCHNCGHCHHGQAEDEQKPQE